MEHVTLARPYAKAAFTYALEKRCLGTWEETLRTLVAILTHGKVRQILFSPELTSKHRSTFLNELAGEVIDQQTRNFLSVLAENNRLALLPFILLQFVKLKETFEKKQTVHVWSAYKLTEAQENCLKEKLEKRLETNVSINSHIDASLVGGIKIQAGDWVYDDTLKARLNKLANAIIA